MKKLYFIANHPAPAELANEYEIVSLTPEQKTIWANIPKSGVIAHIDSVLASVKSVVNEGGIVVAVGEPRACFAVANTAGEGNVFSTFSIRKSVEKQLPDGSVEKTSVFQFDGLVPYEF